MVKLIKRGGFREKTSRQSRYKDSVNHQAEVPQQPDYQSSRQQQEQQQEQPVPETLLRFDPAKPQPATAHDDSKESDSESGAN